MRDVRSGIASIAPTVPVTDGMADAYPVQIPGLHLSSDQRLASYWRLLRRWWRTILFATILAPVLTATLSATLITKSYRAEADIKIVPQNNLTETSVLQQIYGMAGQGAAEQSKEYVATLQSFSFTKWVVRHDPSVFAMVLSSEELAAAKSRAGQSLEWKAYKAISRQFTFYYDNSAGLLRLRYIATSPETAQRMLTILVTDLIANVRDRDIAGYSAQIKSLQMRADQTSDELLRADLYAIIAKRVEQLSTADASALVAFRVIESPFVPPKAYQPRPLLYGAASAAVVPIVLFVLIAVAERSRNFILEQSEEPTRRSLNGSREATGLVETSKSDPRHHDFP